MMCNPSLLIIDDSFADRFILKCELERAGYSGHIFEAADGDEALAFLQDANNKADHPDAFPPSWIFLDINMPKVDGFQFLEAFSELRKKHSELQSSTVKMISSSSFEEDKSKALSYDYVQQYLVKGEYSIDELKAF